MGTGNLEIVDGPAVGGWIESELTGALGSVTGNVPDRFAAYARILHPATGPEGKPVRWEQVAREVGRTVHPLVQWDALVGANRYRHEEPDWPGGEPNWGEFPLELLAPLCELLERHTATPERSFFAVWTSHLTGPSATWFAREEGEEFQPPKPAAPAFSLEEFRRATIDHGGGREYQVIGAPLRLVREVSASVGPERLRAVSPNMIWPQDRAWFVATEIDFDSTLVGGSAELIGQILGDPTFEAFPIGPRDLLTWTADKVNPPLPR